MRRKATYEAADHQLSRGLPLRRWKPVAPPAQCVPHDPDLQLSEGPSHRINSASYATRAESGEAPADDEQVEVGRSDPATFVKVLEPSLSLRDRSEARCQRDVNRRPQPTATRKPEDGCTRPDQGLAATCRNRLRRNGKEGVQGSSP